MHENLSESMQFVFSLYKPIPINHHPMTDVRCLFGAIFVYIFYIFILWTVQNISYHNVLWQGPWQTIVGHARTLPQPNLCTNLGCLRYYSTIKGLLLHSIILTHLIAVRWRRRVRNTLKRNQYDSEQKNKKKNSSKNQPKKFRKTGCVIKKFLWHTAVNISPEGKIQLIYSKYLLIGIYLKRARYQLIFAKL